MQVRECPRNLRDACRVAIDMFRADEDAKPTETSRRALCERDDDAKTQHGRSNAMQNQQHLNDQRLASDAKRMKVDDKRKGTTSQQQQPQQDKPVYRYYHAKTDFTLHERHNCATAPITNIVPGRRFV